MAKTLKNSNKETESTESLEKAKIELGVLLICSRYYWVGSLILLTSLLLDAIYLGFKYNFLILILMLVGSHSGSYSAHLTNYLRQKGDLQEVESAGEKEFPARLKIMLQVAIGVGIALLLLAGGLYAAK